MDSAIQNIYTVECDKNSIIFVLQVRLFIKVCLSTLFKKYIFFSLQGDFLKKISKYIEAKQKPAPGHKASKVIFISETHNK